MNGLSGLLVAEIMPYLSSVTPWVFVSSSACPHWLIANLGMWTRVLYYCRNAVMEDKHALTDPRVFLSS